MLTSAHTCPRAFVRSCVGVDAVGVIRYGACQRPTLCVGAYLVGGRRKFIYPFVTPFPPAPGAPPPGSHRVPLGTTHNRRTPSDVVQIMAQNLDVGIVLQENTRGAPVIHD